MAERVVDAVGPGTVGHWTRLVRAAIARVPGRGGGWRRQATGEELAAPASPAETVGAVRRLRSWIYQDVHLGVPAGDLAADAAGDAVDADVADALRRLATGTWRSPGWRRHRRDEHGRWEVSRDALRLVVPDSALEPATPAGGPHDRAGGPDRCAVRLPRARPGALFGWFAYTGPDGPAAAPEARLYLHPRRLADPASLRRLLAMLDGLGVPWQSKFAVRHTTGNRPDAVVVYLARRDVTPAADRLRAAGVEDLLTDPVPGFSHRLGTGLAAAVHPPGLPSGSFGARVADLYARTLVDHPETDDPSRLVHHALGVAGRD